MTIKPSVCYTRLHQLTKEIKIMFTYNEIKDIVTQNSPEQVATICNAYKDLFVGITRCATGTLYRTKDNTRVMVHKNNRLVELN